MTNERLRTIALSEINPADTLFRITEGNDEKVMADSIARAGIITPPLLQEKKKHEYRIVLGFRRIAALRALGERYVVALLAPLDATDLELFEMVIMEHRSTREFNAMDVSIILQKLRDHFSLDDETIAASYLPIMGYGNNTSVIERLLPLAKLEEAIKRWIREDRLSVEVAHELLEIGDEDRNALFKIMRVLKLGKNAQKELVALCSDVARKENNSISSLCAETEIQNIVGNHLISPPHRWAKMKDYLYRKRYSRYSATVQQFEELRKRLQLPARTELRYSPFFEGEDYLLSARFRSVEECAKLASELRRISESEELKRIMALV